ncbi:hypothetical protein SLITK23_15360 [Streptomyces lividans]|nr:hypothetical protein SLITK23_15360 [Streptomyces lividans]
MTDLISADPDVPILAVMTPVDMSMVPPCRATATFLAGAAGVPAARVSLPLPEATAWAVHLREPSGQWASGQVCTGTALPSASVTANDWPSWKVPRGQGTPTVEPGAAPRPPSSSQLRVTGLSSATGAAAGAACAFFVPSAQLNWAAAPATAAALRRDLRGMGDMAFPFRAGVQGCQGHDRSRCGSEAPAPVPRGGRRGTGPPRAKAPGQRRR